MDRYGQKDRDENREGSRCSGVCVGKVSHIGMNG